MTQAAVQAERAPQITPTPPDPAAVEPRPDITASAIVPAPIEAVFAFLSDLENHWALSDRLVEVVSLDGPKGRRHGGVVQLRGPLGVRRRARTRVVAALEPTSMAGTATIGRRTHARVRWTLTPRGGVTAVELSAAVEGAGALDRLLLAAGGRRWLSRLFAQALDRLASRFARA